MLTVEQLREVQPDRVAAMSRALAANAERVGAVIADTTESAGRDLAGWQGPAAAASTAHRHALADDAHRLREAHAEASTVISGLADRLDEARQLLALADSFAALVGCEVHDRAEVTVLPPTMLGPLATVYDSVRRTAASLAAQALVVAEAADRHASHALGETDDEAAPAAPAPDPAEAGTDPAEGSPADEQARYDTDQLDRLAAAHPAAAELAPLVTLFYAGLPAARREAARHRDPGLVAGLPGAPLTERYAANRALVEANRAELRRTRTELAATPAAERTVTTARTLDAINQRIGTLNSFLAVRPAAAIDPVTGTRCTTRRERQFLIFDPSGAGRVAEVSGRLGTARHVAVLVPGVRNGLDTFNALATDARLLADTAGPDTAVVTWLGYDSVGAGADAPATTQHTRARAAGLALRRFLAGLESELAPGARLVVIGHGFGTALVAAALRAGHSPDDVILVGSPGLGARVRSAADLRPARPGRAGPATTAPGTAAGPRVWVMRAPGDAIAYSRLCGADPADFGDVTRLETQGGAEVIGHARYYAVGGEALDNLARVVTGRRTEVTVTDTTLEEELMLADIDEPAALAPAAAAPPVAVLDGALDAVGGTGA